MQPAAVVARLTVSSLLGPRRVAVLLVLPLVLVGLAGLFRAVGGGDLDTAVRLLGTLALGTVVPLLCVVVGTGAIGPEIEDGSILYVLSKPLRRRSTVLSKLAVAVATAWTLLVPAVLAAGLLLAGTAERLAVAYVVAAAVAYCALFLLLAVVTRNAVVLGLLYALVWETTVAGVVPGARALSVRQWALAVAQVVVGTDAARLGVDSDVALPSALVLLVLVTCAATAYAVARLRRLRVGTGED